MLEVSGYISTSMIRSAHKEAKAAIDIYQKRGLYAHSVGYLGDHNPYAQTAKKKLWFQVACALLGVGVRIINKERRVASYNKFHR